MTKLIIANRKRDLLCLAICCFLALATAFFLVPHNAYAEPNEAAELSVDPVVHSENTTAVIYNNMNGLPTSEANAIAETSEGFIWIGSYGGLVRYDGNTFHRMDSTKGIGSVVSLFVDSRDRLWIGTNESGLALLQEDTYRFWGIDDGFAGAKVTSITENDEGIIYAGTNAGISMIDNDFIVSSIDDPRVAGNYIEHVYSGKDGLIYATTSEDDFFTIDDGKVVDYISRKDTKIREVTTVLPDPNEPGKLYVGGVESTIYHTNISLDPQKGEAIDISPLSSVINIEMIDGRLWICARNGIGVIDDNGFHYLELLPMNNSVTDVMADYEGNLWFASARQGVMKLVSNRFFNVFERFGLEEEVVNTTCVLDGRLFVGTDTGLIALDDESQVKEIPLTRVVTASGKDIGSRDLLELLKGNRIRSIIRDSKDRLWISTWRGAGLVCYDKSGTATVYTEQDGLLSEHIRTVYETKDGSFMVANTGGLSIIRDGKVVKSYSKENGIENPETLTVCEAPNGDMLLGSNGGGIYVINDEGTRVIDTHDGLTSGIVMRIKFDEDHKVFWLVTSNSISYMTEDYKVTSVAKFPYSNNFDLYENSKGDVWVLSSNGIYVVSADELIANRDIQPVFYGTANGLPCIATSNSYSELTDKGDLYIAGGTGVTQVNIEESLEDIKDLKQAVPFITADGKFYYPDEDGNFKLPSTARKVTIYAYVYNYSLTEPKVSYRLAGFDRRSLTVSRSDFGPLTYTNLPGGMYQFNMEISDAMDRERKASSVKIYKAMAIHEQAWFKILLLAAGVAFAFFMLMSYTNRRVKVLLEKQREEAERERISHELDMASRIQVSMLPNKFPPFPERDEFEIYATMDPAREVGGDFYDFFFVDDDHLCLIIADVSGKGVPASLYMMISKVILEIYTDLGNSPAEIMESVNKRLIKNNTSDMFVTVWLGILEISSGRMKVANAGHEYPAIKKKGGTFEIYKDSHGIILGGMEDIKYSEYELDMMPGDMIFVYTDGVPEARNTDKEMFGIERMLQALNTDPGAGPEDLLGIVRKAVDGFSDDEEQFDDLTMLCLKYKGK